MPAAVRGMIQPSTRRLDWVRDEASGEHLFFDAVTVHHNPFYERYMLQLHPISVPARRYPDLAAIHACGG